MSVCTRGRIKVPSGANPIEFLNRVVAACQRQTQLNNIFNRRAHPFHFTGLEMSAIGEGDCFFLRFTSDLEDKQNSNRRVMIGYFMDNPDWIQLSCNHWGHAEYTIKELMTAALEKVGKTPAKFQLQDFDDEFVKFDSKDYIANFRHLELALLPLK